MRVDPYWIASPFKLAIMPRPRPHDWLEDELMAWRQAGIDVIVSCLTTYETIGLGLEAESSICNKHSLIFISFPIMDRQTPQSEQATIDLIHKLQGLLTEGKGIAVHCRMGIGRSALVCACLLVRLGMRVEDAFASIEAARGVPVPDTDEQRHWVHNLSHKL